MRSAVYLGIAASILTLTLIAASCDRATDPRPPAPREWDLLIQDEAVGGRYYKYSTETSSITDSFVLPFRGSPAGLSPDGEVLYIRYRDSITVFDLLSRQQIGTLQGELGVPLPGRIRVSADGRFVATADRENGLHMFNTINYSLFAFMPGAYPEFQDYSFSADGRTFYTVNRQNIVRTYRMEDTLILENEVTTTGLLPGRIVGNSAGSVIALLTFDLNAPRDFQEHFEVHDLATGAMLYDTILPPPGGFIRFSPDEKYVFASSAGTPFQFAADTFYLHVYDVAQNAIIKNIDTEEGRINHFNVTPDSKWLIGAQFECGAKITVINLETMALDTVVRYGTSNLCFEWVLGVL